MNSIVQLGPNLVPHLLCKVAIFSSSSDYHASPNVGTLNHVFDCLFHRIKIVEGYFWWKLKRICIHFDTKGVIDCVPADPSLKDTPSHIPS